MGKMIEFKQKGDFSKILKALNPFTKGVNLVVLNRYGKAGVEALKRYTPKQTGKTSESWYYKIETTGSGVSIAFYNSNIQNGFSVAIMLQYGHGTRNGGYVQGVDYINPALRPIFEKFAERAYKEAGDNGQ